jgi:hypothetical protein
MTRSSLRPHTVDWPKTSRCEGTGEWEEGGEAARTPGPILAFHEVPVPPGPRTVSLGRTRGGAVAPALFARSQHRGPLPCATPNRT